MKTFLAVRNTYLVAPFPRAALGLLVFTLSFCFSRFAESEELVSFNNVSASVSSDYKCQPETNVRLDAPEEDSYRKSRVDMQKLSRIVKTYLWLDCKEIESIDFEGYAEGNDEALYRATAEKKNDWFLQEQPVDDADENKQKDVEKEEAPSEVEPVRDDELASSTESENPQVNAAQKENLPSSPQEKNKFSSLESLEAAAATSPKAQLELAKGLLDLPEKIEGIEFPDDPDRGVEILEKLASEGNPDAMQLLSEAYSSDKGIDLNIPLIEALTGRPMVDGEDQRGTASAMMTLDAAAKGSELAVDALQDAGQAGSNMSYYAVGMMYLLDKAKKMPYDEEFLEQELEIESDVAGSGGSGNVDVGLHFLALAAENGNSEAQELLTDMEVEFEMPESNSGSSSEPPNDSSGAASPLLLSSATAEVDNPSEDSTQAGEAEETESGESGSPAEESTDTGVAAAQTSASQDATSQDSTSQDSTSQDSSAQAVSNATAKNEAYTEALMEAGALNELLDRRNEDEGSALEPDATKQNSVASSKSGTATGQPDLTSENKENLGAGAGQQSTRQVTRSRARKSQTSSQRRGHSEYGGMNTEQNEAEIID